MVLKVGIPLVESAKVEVYEGNDEVELTLLEEVGSEYEVLLAEVLTDVFEYVMIEEVEGIGTAMVVAAELVEEELEAELREVAEVVGAELLEEDSDTEEVEELELYSVVTGSGTSIVTVGELTSMIEYPVVVTVAGLGVTETSTV